MGISDYGAINDVSVLIGVTFCFCSSDRLSIPALSRCFIRLIWGRNGFQSGTLTKSYLQNSLAHEKHGAVLNIQF